MKHDWKAERVEAVASVTGVLISLIGFLFVGYQIKQTRNQLDADSHERLLRHNLEVLGHVIEHPEIRPFLYEDHRIVSLDGRDDAARLRSQVLTGCEIFTDLFEHVALQCGNMPDDLYRDWEAYAKSMYRRSYELRAFLASNRHWYSPQLHGLAGLREGWPDLPTNPMLAGDAVEPAPDPTRGRIVSSMVDEPTALRAFGSPAH